MVIIRLLATAFLVIAATAVSFELFELLRTSAWHPIMADQFWHNLHAESLDSIRIFVQREVHPALWDWVISPILQLPAWMVAGVPGLLLMSLNIWANMSPSRKSRRPKFRTAG